MRRGIARGRQFYSNVILTIKESMIIHLARRKIKQHKKSLNVIFKKWAARCSAKDQMSTDYQELMKKLNYAKADKHFSRDELNETS